MSTKHYFPSTAANSLVPKALGALVAGNPHLHLDEVNRAVSNTYHDPSNVSIIGGGGSGHEPAWSGYVGEGMLSAAACGDIFASPSTKQVLAAMRAAPSTKGHILLITNYTGDRLHFGLAAERARVEGLSDHVVVLPASDDVSIGREKSSRLGRRGLAGHVLTIKILGAAASRGLSLDDCLRIGRAVNESTVTIGTTLDYCHVPGRLHQALPDDVCVLGAGIHNEPGQQRLSPLPAVGDLVKQCLALLCDPSDSERAFTSFATDDQVVLLVNNYGGVSPLELGALTGEVLDRVKTDWGLSPVRILSGTFETSLNAPGFSVTLCNLNSVAKSSGSNVDLLLELLDSQTTAVSWPNTARPTGPRPTVRATRNESKEEETFNRSDQGHGHDFLVSSDLLHRMVRSSCERVIKAEPKLTEWDLIMGDGDCGEAVKGLAESVILLLNKGDYAPRMSIIEFVGTLSGAVDDMGGTLGAIFGILLSAFHTSLRGLAVEKGTEAADLESAASSSLTYARALSSAVWSLKSHTSAREGDRTVMDVLLPFADEFAATGDFKTALAVAQAKAEGTRFIKAKMGRATYVGDETAQEVPDPGAWALFEILAGLGSVSSSG